MENTETKLEDWFEDCLIYSDKMFIFESFLDKIQNEKDRKEFLKLIKKIPIKN
jgi:hypothetical protein